MSVKSLAAGLVGSGWVRWGILLVATGAVVGFAARAQGAEQPAALYKGSAAISVRTAVATEGQMLSALSYSGDLKANTQVNVLPKGSGRIERLLVDVGSKVKRGDVLAELESATLKAQVSQAKANVAAAEARYGNMEAGSRPEQVTQARANLQSARAKLSAMAQGGRTEQISQAQAALEVAWANREKLNKGATEADLAAARGAVDGARANLTIAQAKLETLRQGPTQAEWAAANSAVDSARAAIKAAQANLDDVKAGAKDSEIWAAQNAVDLASAQLHAANDRVDTWKGTSSDAEKMATGATSTSAAVKGSEAAQTALDAAVARLNLLKSRPLPHELQAAQTALDSARAGYDAAAARVEQMKRGATAQEMQQAEAGASAAEAALASAEARLRQLREGATEEDRWLANSAVRQAEQAVALVEDPFRSEDLVQAQSAVTVAEQGLALAQNPYTKFDLAQAQAGVDQARAALEMAQIALADTVVTSPVDGVVTERHQSLGSLVSPAAPIVSVISTDLELVLGVEESQIGQVAEGQRVEITVAAYPGTVFGAKVASIGPAADPKSRTFQVKVRPEAMDGRLKQGMFAQARITTQERANAVLVPREAVVTRAGESYAFVLKEDVAEKRTVTLGMRRDGTVEVVSGLTAGDEVVVAGQTELTDGETVRRAS